MLNRRQLLSVAQWISRIVLAGVLLLAGVLKLQDNTSLFEAVAYITWLPLWLKLPDNTSRVETVTCIAWVPLWLKVLIIDWLPFAEILVAVLLLIRWQERVVLPVVGLIFLGFLGFSIYGTATGMEGDCGCFGNLMESTFGAKMIIRNTIFMGMAGLLFMKPPSPPF